MEQPVKERLVGAAVLVGLIVVLVPEMLSGPRQDDTPRTDDAALRTYTLDLSAPGPSRAPPPHPRPQPALALPAPVPRPAQPPSQPEAQSKPTPVERSPRATASPSAPAAEGAWVVQVGSFAQAENAERLAQTLSAQGYPAFVSTTGTGPARRHRVRVGPPNERAEAEQLVQRLQQQGHAAQVVAR